MGAAKQTHLHHERLEMVEIHHRLDVRDLTVVSCLFVCFLNKTLISIIVTARVKKDSNNMYFYLRLLTWIRIDQL